MIHERKLEMPDYRNAPQPDNPAAFPGLHPSRECHYQNPGMTLRDYFAAFAMQGFIAAGIKDAWEAEHLGTASYATADAMLKARES